MKILIYASECLSVDPGGRAGHPLGVACHVVTRVDWFVIVVCCRLAHRRRRRRGVNKATTTRVAFYRLKFRPHTASRKQDEIIIILTMIMWLRRGNSSLRFACRSDVAVKMVCVKRGVSTRPVKLQMLATSWPSVEEGYRHI